LFTTIYEQELRMNDNRKFFSLAGLALSVALPAGPFVTRADSSKYPQYAQHTLPPDVKPEFVAVESLVNEIINRRTPVIIDVRSAQEFQETHIKGSLSIPLGDMAKRLQEIPRDRPVVLY
jgi:hypothetical protein